MHSSGSHIIQALRRKWMYKAAIAQLFVALAMSLIVYSILHRFYNISFYVFLIFFSVTAILLLLIDKKIKITNDEVSRFLNINAHSLEESAGLLLKPTSALNLLEIYQYDKVLREFEKLKMPDPLNKRLIISAIVLLISSIISLAFFNSSIGASIVQHRVSRSDTKLISKIPEILLPEIKRANVIVVPPSYTGKAARQVDKFNLVVEEGGTVIWKIQMNLPPQKVSLLFNDGQNLALSKDNSQLEWRSQRQISRPGFYQVKIDENLSELYKIETIKDQAPVIAITSPAPNTNIRYGSNQAVQMKGRMSDDYGIRSTYISATVSSGQGEGVKFKEIKLPVNSFQQGQRQMNLQQSIGWKAMGMRPGDELYFYISAIDNQNQETRSQVYILTLEDTANQTSMNGMVSPLDIQQELFRSQRQIIIETEQLLKNKSRISGEEFTRKSNNLGLDQKLLRMRYGKFLGEETDVEIGEEQEHEDETHTDDPQSIIDQYSHKHDNAEDASFFDAATKKQLKATLAEMWKAEMKLRTILPKDALPFEYKALALLKDLQQKSRVYVAKTGIKTTPLKLDKRLTGDLSKISQPVIQQNVSISENPSIDLRTALGVLEELKINGSVDERSTGLLNKAFYQLSLKAADLPSVYIPALSAMKKVISNKFRVKDISVAQEGLQRMAATVDKLPYPGSSVNMALTKQYYKTLKANGQ